MNIFGKKGKIILSAVCTFCLLFATVLGIISAKWVTNIYLGEEILLDSLDKQTGVGMVNILLLGVDKGGMRSDTIMLASLNGRTGEVNVLSIPRDTRILVGNHYQKINATVGIGAQEVSKGNLNEPEELIVQKVKLLTGLPIHYFMSIDFNGFKEVIDALGGVDFDVPVRMKYSDPVQDLYIDLQPGFQHLDGDAAHDLVRFRSYPTGDLGRIETQQAFMKALIEQKLTAKNLMKVDEIFDVVCRNVRTNYTAKDLIRHLGAISKIDADSVTMHQLPGSAQYIGGISYYICDSAATQELVETVFNPSSDTNKSE